MWVAGGPGTQNQFGEIGFSSSLREVSKSETHEETANKASETKTTPKKGFKKERGQHEFVQLRGVEAMALLSPPSMRGLSRKATVPPSCEGRLFLRRDDERRTWKRRRGTYLPPSWATLGLLLLALLLAPAGMFPRGMPSGPWIRGLKVVG